MKFLPPLVFSLHGIRTDGRWQKWVADALSGRGIATASFDYGRFGIPSLFFRRDSLIDRFYSFAIDRIDSAIGVDLADPSKRPSVIAHSLGTYVIGRCLIKHPDLKIDKLILVGSVLPCDFDWQELMARDQIGMVWNQIGECDWVPRLASWMLDGAGDSGKRGFDFYSELIHEESGVDFCHSDGLLRQHFQQVFLPFLQRNPRAYFVIEGADIPPNQVDSVFRQTGRLDDLVYGHDPHYLEARIPDGLAEGWIQANPDIYSFLAGKNGTIEGYINAMPMEDEYFEKLLNANPIMETEITAEWIAPYGSHQKLNMYLLSIVVSPEVRKMASGLFSPPLEILVVGFVDKLIRLFRKRKIVIKKILAVGWTIQGSKLCELLGMTRVRRDKFDHWVYCLDIEEALRQNERPERRTHHAIRRLLQVYLNH